LSDPVHTPDTEHLSRAIAVAGVSHSCTPALVREQLHLGPEQAGALSRSLAAGEREAVVLATCNRTELYVTGSDARDAQQRARLALARLGGPTVPLHTAYVYANDRAASHLFRVAAGLESIVLGDTHIAGQVREAHGAARIAGATGPLLDRLFEAASGASKRVRWQTSISSGHTSIPAAAIATAAHVAGPLADRRVLIIGAGKIARLAALAVTSRGCRHITVANRTIERAQELAQRVGGRASSLAQLASEFAAADVVVTATGSPGYVVTDDCATGPRPLAIFDLALPRDVDPALRAGSRLFDLDDLGSTVAAAGAWRQAHVARAGAIVCEEAARYEAWRRGRAAAPAIIALRDGAEQTRRTVLARHAAELARLGSVERELVETITRQLVGKLVHTPTLELRRHAAQQSA
jgi:glutamyl-tRNA reductase